MNDSKKVIEKTYEVSEAEFKQVFIHPNIEKTHLGSHRKILQMSDFIQFLLRSTLIKKHSKLK